MTNKQDIIRTIEKRMQTIMIGSLAKFEENFGHLWNDETLKDSDKFWELWEQARNQILNNGNNQLRCAVDELGDFLYNNNFNMKKNNKPTYKYKFYFKDGENTDER